MAQLLRKSITPGKNIYIMTPRIGMVAQKQKMIHQLVNHEGSVYTKHRCQRCDDAGDTVLIAHASNDFAHKT